MKKFISFLLVCVMLLCSLTSFAAYEIEYAGSAAQNPALKEIIKSAEYTDLNAFATRSQFAQIFAFALPEVALKAINEVISICEERKRY